MAENTTEDTKHSTNNDDMSETPSATSATNETASDEGKGELTDIDKASTSKEDTDVNNEKVVKDTDLTDKEKQNAFKTDCNGDSKEETKSGNASLEKIEVEVKENLKEFSSTEERSDNQEVRKCSPDIDQRLNEILKVVHGDLQMEMLQKIAGVSTNAKDNDEEDGSGKDQQMVKKEGTPPRDNVCMDSSKKYTASATLKSTEDERDSRSFSMRAEEKSEIGIVGSPTTISELINEEELGGDSALSVDQKDHIVEWVENSAKVNADEENNIAEECQPEMYEKNTMETTKRQKLDDAHVISSRKSQKIVSNIIKKSIKCLNRMHAMEGATEGRRRQVDTAEDDKTAKSSSSSEIPQSQQNGAALPEETAAAPTATVSRVRTKRKTESPDTETPDTKNRQLLADVSQKVAAASGSNVTQHHSKVASESVDNKKRKSTNGQLSVNPRKKFCNEDEREEYISQIIGTDNETVDVLMEKADRLRADIVALENLAHVKEMEWNEILRKRKLKEEAYARLERKIQMTAFMENDGQLPDPLPLASSSLGPAEWDNSDNAISMSGEKSFESKEDLTGEASDLLKREKDAKVSPQQRVVPSKTNGESNRKRNLASSPESRQIGEGRQGAIVDVRSIIADHRLKHPETVPRRGRRMRNSVNVGLGAGGAMVETGHNTDSRPSSTESCKSNPSTNDSMNYKDILVQFAKMSQQGEGTSAKVPQNYPDVTLHPVAVPSSASQNTASQPTGSLLHGILTKAQSPRSTTFSPTLARLLTAPERERNPAAAAAAAVASMSQQSATNQHLLQTYQGSNLVSINDILSSSKARTEITITPVVNSSAQSHSNDLIQVEDVEEETTVIDDRKGSSSSGREGKQIAKDNPPSPSAPPKCQGCMIRPAQFVCAGCGNQWYCSRTCQLAAWATHSEYCSDYPLESENSKVKPNV
ncbi:putative leucine-rich repeat-containing protein DDB_G0290503 isoform X3 [Camponotus floridanus]|uniref:putative leucine-rich repeat-containing protein DDB_G0290503 isoform X3 n=1 Tax=Camponotus floridanus TaxID=104421 RepID=UPI00059E7567|nr:putative leucine-rich repeat-containing protein DDB_G0290503 isoform X3 [Camponotus floridanus]